MTAKRLTPLAVAAIFLVAASAQEKAPDAVPKLVVAAPTHDFGQVNAGTPLTHTFKVKNEGKADLQILSVAPG